MQEPHLHSDSADKPETPCCGGSQPGQAPCGNASTRRDWLLRVGFGLNAIAGAMIGLPIIGYVLSSFFKIMPIEWIDLGPVDKFPEGTTRLATYRNPKAREWDGQTADLPCWVRRVKATEFQVFAINCAHLGCPVRWFEESNLFLCPCHGGVYYADGSRASGPPPRGLYTYPYKIVNNSLHIQGGILPTLAETTA